ncbi:hypothetical protein [Lewinella sp. IMCC34191]|uniref:hypothetical protein n=1 Tax=Lewinella sp. IMCC34191 TaxID=2259172 RepID=UPI000E26D93C|nr:hypothetical protein [Lewinella sp. IMCC34191]
MRYLTLLCCCFLLAACVSDMPIEDMSGDDIYPVAASPAETAAADSLAAAQPAGSPTPYGMVIDPESDEQQAKGASAQTALPALAAQKMLTGRWANTSDSEEVVEFTPTHYKTYYQGELLVEEDMTFHGACPEACSGGTSTGEPCFTISGPAQTDCYGIVRLTDDVLELQVLGVSSETVVYRRAD